MSEKLNKQIAFNLCQAQRSSDLGKEKKGKLNRAPIFAHANSLQGKTRFQGYNPKDGFILKAVNLCCFGQSDFNYYIEARPDQNGNDSFVILFDTKVSGKRVQISFHSFNKRLWKDRVGEGRPTHWDGKIGGSEKACVKLINYYKL